MFQAMHDAIKAHLIQGQSEQNLDTAPSPPPNETTRNLQREPDQMHRYWLPDYIVESERELLSEYDAEDLVELLKKIRNEFVVPTFFLQNFDEHADPPDGFILRQAGENLDYAYTMLNRVYFLFMGFKPQLSVSKGSV